jgi:hypothetical protein
MHAMKNAWSNGPTGVKPADTESLCGSGSEILDRVVQSLRTSPDIVFCRLQIVQEVTLETVRYVLQEGLPALATELLGCLSYSSRWTPSLRMGLSEELKLCRFRFAHLPGNTMLACRYKTLSTPKWNASSPGGS